MLENQSFAAKIRLNRSAQALMWDRAFRAFHGEADKYLALMEETDNAGPGSLELNPDMDLPDYACHEIHAQPGGFVGDPFAGWVYHWALTQAFYQARNEYDQVHLAIAQGCPKPANGEVHRILDMGCGSGSIDHGLQGTVPRCRSVGYRCRRADGALCSPSRR